jgi:hypothetical protein
MGNTYGQNHNQNMGSGTAYFGSVTQHYYPGLEKSGLSPDCLESLVFPEMDSRSTQIQTAAAGTCEWLLRHKAYGSWASNNRNPLCIKGKPGSGKSTLIRYARSRTEGLPRSGDEPLVLSFFFHGRGTELQKTPSGLFRSLLCQLNEKLPKALDGFEATFKKKTAAADKYGEEWQWVQEELQELFESSLSEALKTCPVWLFVDALDECGEDNAVELAKRFKSLNWNVRDYPKRLRICFTCRHYPNLDLIDVSEIHMEHENSTDISTFVQKELHWFRERWDSTIPDLVTSRANGVFLWAVLVVKKVLELVEKGVGPEDIKSEVLSVPQELYDLYGELTRSMNQDSLKLIQWICFAIRPLSLTELRWAMLVEADCAHNSLQECQNAGSYESKDTWMDWKVKQLTWGLTEITLDTNVVQFTHQSVKDFFVEKGLLAPGRTSKRELVAEIVHDRLSRICIRYLGMEEFGQLQGLNRYDMNARFPLLDYATTSWLVHRKRIYAEDLTESFTWPSNDFVKRWVDIYRILHIADSPERPPEGATLVHVLSIYEMAGALQAILTRAGQYSLGIDTRDSRGLTPLCWAIERRQTAVVDILLQEGAKADYHYKIYRWTALTAITEALRSDVSWNDGVRLTRTLLRETLRQPLSTLKMIGSSYKTFAKIAMTTLGDTLLRRREFEATFADVEMLVEEWIQRYCLKGSPRWRTPLLRAVEMDDATIVQCLLKHRADPNFKDKNHRAPLSRAKKWKKRAIIDLLLENGAREG